jgi:transcriptional regulator with XRE-family HTH domain
VQFLDAVRKRHGLPSDRKLAAHLGIDQPRVVAYRKRRRTLDPDACIAVAAALKLPPEYVLASVQAERAKRTEHRKLWERLAKVAREHLHVLEIMAVAGLATSAAIAPSPAHASTTAAGERGICILCYLREGDLASLRCGLQNHRPRLQ